MFILFGLPLGLKVSGLWGHHAEEVGMHYWCEKTKKILFLPSHHHPVSGWERDYIILSFIHNCSESSFYILIRLSYFSCSRTSGRYLYRIRKRTVSDPFKRKFIPITMVCGCCTCIYLLCPFCIKSAVAGFVFSFCPFFVVSFLCYSFQSALSVFSFCFFFLSVRPPFRPFFRVKVPGPEVHHTEEVGMRTWC